jgi:hypothetical protein
MPKPENHEPGHQEPNSTKEKLHKKALIAYAKLKQRESQEEFRDEKCTFRHMDEEEFRKTFGTYPMWGSTYNLGKERKLFKITLNKPCGCGLDHATCPTCPKFRIIADGEWVSEVMDAKYEVAAL